MITKKHLTKLILAGLLCLGQQTYASGIAADSTKHVTPPKEQQSVTAGSVTIQGKRIEYTATTGTIILKDDNGKPTASMFYVAYTKKGTDNPTDRPVTFFWNGGPGSSTVWLHMGAFGPKRVETNDHTHTPAAPYKLLNNDNSLLDVTDEVFVDAVGTGFSRIIGKDKGGAGKPDDFFGVDADAQSFAHFIRNYLSDFNRWNSPKYIFGESYGTTRAALLSKVLGMRESIDLNGVILLSSIIDFHTASYNAGNDLPYELFLPSMTATAWYHHKLPNQPENLQPLLKEVEHFALTDYAEALAQGNNLDESKRSEIIGKLHMYTGLTESYINKANLRVTAGEFEKELLADSSMTTGRLDSRYSGPTMDPLSQTREYDPHSASISSAYVSLFNQYVHNELKFGKNMHYRPSYGGANRDWEWKHRNSTNGQAWPGSPNVAVDMAQAMKYNPNLKVMVNSGYFDLGTPFFATDYTLDHMDIPADLQKNIESEYYESGHMVYLHLPSLKRLHDNVAAFITKTDNVK